MLKMVLFLSLVATAPAFAGKDIKELTEPPKFDLMGSIGNNSALSMHCYGDPPFQEIDCTFTQLMISATQAKDAAERKEETDKELDKLQQKDIEGMKKELTTATMEKFEKRMKGATPEQQGYAQDLTLIFKNLAASNNKAAFKKSIIDQHNMEAATCSITVNNFEQHFSRISRNKWLHNPGPAGLCNVVRISTLENLDEYPELWTYTQTTVTADKAATCQKWVDVGGTIINSWDSPKSFKFERCKYIQFGY